MGVSAAVARAIIIVTHSKGSALSNQKKGINVINGYISVFCGYNERTSYKSGYKISHVNFLLQIEYTQAINIVRGKESRNLGTK